MTQSIVCGACGAGVRPGRLSCPECGEMLATVAGAVRRPASVAALDRPAGAAPGAGASVPPTAVADPPAPAVLHDAAEPQGLRADDAPAWPEAAEDSDPAEGSHAEAVDPPSFGRSSSLAGAPAGGGSVAGGIGGAAWSATVATPGAYLPPVLQPAGPPAPARAWAGHGAGDAAAGPGTTGSAAHLGSADGPATSTDSPAGGASAADKATEFVGWLAIAGGALAAAGFLLPWSSFSVIGADGAGYFDLWGLAGPGHVVVALAVLGIVAAAAMRERVPLWLGIGLPGLGVGALLAGLVWPYLLALPGAQIGAIAVLVGALLLVGAGVAALVLDRHARDEPVV